MAPAETKLLTAEEFWEWQSLSENSEKHYELKRGKIVEMPLRGKRHGFVCANVIGILGNFAARRKKGYLCSNNSAITVQRDPDTVRGPDVSFFEDDQNVETMDRKFATLPPQLVVEVLLPNQPQGKTHQRIKEFLKHGVPLIWLVDPEERVIAIYQPGKEFELVEENQELTGNDVLSDFHCPVADFFALPGQLVD